MKTDFEIWQNAWRFRRDYVESLRLEAFRLINGTGDGCDGLTVDFYAGRYLLTAASEKWLKNRESTEAQLRRLHCELNSSTAPSFFWNANLPGFRQDLSTAAPETFNVWEGRLCFEVHLGAGPHPGLFLDQRENRRRLQKLAKHSRGLNLFCHTGAFTVAALAGGAEQVISVDLSKNYLQWLERNLKLNDLPGENHRGIADDAMEYLRKLSKSQPRLDWIILDPPTFSRGKKGNFSTARDFNKLVEICLQALAPRGKLLACLNTRSISLVELKNQLKQVAAPLGRKILETPAPPRDFPAAPECQGNPSLKSVWLG